MTGHRNTLDERLAGAAWGHLVGDAAGVPYEFTGPRDPVTVEFGANGTWGRPAGTWSDGGRASVSDAFWSAWDAFSGAADYAETIRRAIAYGHDTDTTAAIAGGLAGARWGFGAIPVPWRRGMRGREVAGPIVDRLVETTGARTSRSRPLRVDDVAFDGAPGLEGAAGRLGITFLPGKKRDGWTGPHWRDVDLDVARLRDLRWDTLVLLNEDDELVRCHVPLVEGGMDPEKAMARVQASRDATITKGDQRDYVRTWPHAR